MRNDGAAECRFQQAKRYARAGFVAEARELLRLALLYRARPALEQADPCA